MHRGTFTTKSNLKKGNRELEFKLREAEMRQALAAAFGGTDREISSRLDTLLGETDRRVWFNSLPWRRDSLTFLPDETGSAVRDGQKGFWTRPGLDALSCGEPAVLPGREDWLRTGQEGDRLLVRTPLYDLALNPDGSFASWKERASGREWVRPGCGMNRLHIWADHPGVYDAWDILPNYRDVEIPLPVTEPLRLINQDGVTAEFAVDFATGKSTWRMIVRLFADAPEIEVEHLVDWHENTDSLEVKPFEIVTLGLPLKQ